MGIVNSCEKKVFLTFDDGIHPGTQEVYALLVSKGVKATFFLTGAHVEHAVNEDDQLSLLQNLYSDANIDIGNHSSSHANQYYEGYYESGGVLLADGKDRRTVLVDFQHCDATLAKHLNVPKKQFTNARLPGQNSWRGVTDVADDDSGIDYLNEANDEADALKEAGYKLFGWDYEWKMDFGGTNNHSDYDPEVDRKCANSNDTFCWDESESKKSFRFDTTLDRPNYNGATAAKHVMSSLGAWYFGTPRKDGKLIVLMHERAFRSYTASSDPQISPPPRDDTYLKYLGKFIDALLEKGVCFDKISNY